MSAIGEFSSRLKLLRKKKNLQQGELAKELGVSRGSISFYENGDRVPDIEFLSKASEYFGVSADWLLGLSTVSSLDTNVRTVCDATGLNQKIVKYLIEWNKKDYGDDEVNPILEFNTLFGDPARLWTLLLCVYAHSLNFDLLNYLKNDIAEERQHCYSEDTGWERPERARDFLRQVLELEKEIRYARFEAIDTFTSIFDGVQETEALDHTIQDLLDQFKGIKLDDADGA